MVRTVYAATLLLSAALLLAACGRGKSTDQPSQGTQAGSGTAGGTQAGNGTAGVPAGNSPIGTWYEQSVNADQLEITDKVIRTPSYDGTTVFEVGYTYDGIGDEPELVMDDIFLYEDIYYNKADDTVIAYTMSHTDGDGGHHRVVFARTAYAAPPPPVYGPAVDKSDPDAKKDFDDLTIRTMKVSFYDEGMPYDVDSSMAPEAPYPDEYSYDLTVLEDGTALASSSFCQEIKIPKDTVDELQRMAREADLGQINGIDIHTEDVPYGSPEYEAEIGLASGDTIRSSANWTDVPESWSKFQNEMHHLLFWAFVDAGYNFGSGEFHSKAPMKRIPGEETLRKSDTGILEDETQIVPDWKKSFDYSLDTKYFVFTDPDNQYPALMKTLNTLSEQYKKKAEETLQKHYEVMEAVPKSTWKNADRKYCYSLYAVDQWSLSRNIFSFMVSEGEANSMGAGDFGYGKYRYTRFNIDVESGDILTVSDLFTDTDAIYDVLMEKFMRYGTHNDSGKFVHSDAFPAFLRKALEAPEPEGIGWNAYYDRIELWMPLGMYEGNDSQLREVLYYDEIQDILADAYTSVW